MARLLLQYVESYCDKSLFYIIGKCFYDIKKPSGQDRTAAVRNDVAEATRRRRRIPRVGFFLGFSLQDYLNITGYLIPKRRN